MKVGWLAFAALVVAASTVSAKTFGVDDLAGVYKSRFPNGDVGGDSYQSEDILEIVKVSENTAYVRVELKFFNGHTCGIYGVADLRGRSLVYEPKSVGDEYDGKHCALTLKAQGGKLIVSDRYSCKAMHCGERGAFEGSAFDLKSKRPIRYMSRLKSSSQFAEAMRERSGR